MESKIEPTYLANKNAHPRDSHILFDEGPHIYTIDGDSDYLSVTTWNHSHFPHFDSDKIINNCPFLFIFKFINIYLYLYIYIYLFTFYNFHKYRYTLS